MDRLLIFFQFPDAHTICRHIYIILTTNAQFRALKGTPAKMHVCVIDRYWSINLRFRLLVVKQGKIDTINR